FFDFLTNTGLIAAIGLVITLVYFYLVFHKEIKGATDNEIDYSKLPDPKSAITDQKGFIVSTLIFAIAVVLLVTHGSTGLTVAFIGVFVALLTIFSNLKHFREIMKGVDYKTLLFFIGLFVVVGGLEETGVLKVVADFIAKVSEGNPYVMIAIVIWVSGIASAFIDNIPFSATMVPIIQALSASMGVPLETIAWALSMGTDSGGSATPIGASANVVGTSTSAKAGHPISWGRYCAKAAPVTAIVLARATVMIFVRYM
ncbi:MAG: SLC13 family permease, partial [Lachnospiraceae bacterium]|nr:SLC13 family permease [Lachnospiraceae bacterium]